MKTNIILLLLLGYNFLFSQPRIETSTTAHFYCPPCNLECDDKIFNAAGTCDVCGMKLTEMTPDQRVKQMKEQMTIAFYLQDRVEILDFAGPLEVLSYSGFEIFTVSKTKDPIRSQGILTVIPDYSIEDAPHAEILAFFGGNSGAASGDPEVIKWIRSRTEVDYHFSVCTGAFVLAESGQLTGKTATTFHSALSRLRDDYPEINVRDNVRFVDNGKVITTAGISAGIDGALHLVAKLKGLAVARLVAYNMEYDKWKPGEGLILSEDNPYDIPILSRETLTMYEGTYEVEGGKKAIVVAGEEGNTLYAIIENRVSPLFYISKDHYLNERGDELVFLWEGNKVAAYTRDDEKRFKKLNDQIKNARNRIINIGF
ncbi:DJ-1/PfpI family protein [Fulvivirga sp. M361]|uniref:DJ-1/PfpI family protein n=1 Tax=Fulvivirga sp. M361 TaxID=2594266 RepID=UPI00117B8F1C|nr:DJ-1/PfpI family protein [Fulvivirga sp. M361]TRX57673.1 DJ-1/PfpI family protein [Fulvivirga sp. M361]